MASIDTTPPHPTNPDAPAQRLLRLAQAAASQPFQKQQRQSMLGVLRERLAAVRNGDPVPSVGALLNAFPGGENGYWGAWLDHKQVAEAVPAAQLMALHAVSEIFDNVLASNLTALTAHPALVVSTASALEEVRRVQDEMTPLLVGHLATPEALRSRLLWLEGHPQYAHLICSGLREWLATGAVEPAAPEPSSPKRMLIGNEIDDDPLLDEMERLKAADPNLKDHTAAKQAMQQYPAARLNKNVSDKQVVARLVTKIRKRRNSS